MSFHHELWVTVGTVSPLISLAQVVLVGRAVTQLRDDRRLLTAYELPEEVQAEGDALKRDHWIASVRYHDTLVEQFWLRRSNSRHSRSKTRDERVARRAELRGLELAYGPTARRSAAALSQWERQHMSARLPLERAWRAARLSDYLATAGWLLSVFALATALLSLTWERDVIPPIWVSVVVILVSLTVIAPVISESATRAASRTAFALAPAEVEPLTPN